MGWLFLAACSFNPPILQASDLTVSGNLTVTGTGEIDGNTLKLGTRTDTGSYPGWLTGYTDGTTSSVEFDATRSANVWKWQQNGSTSLKLQMSLSDANALVIFDQSSTPVAKITLNPLGGSTFENSVALNGTDNQMPNQTLTGTSSVLTEGLGDGRYVPLGTSLVIGSSASANTDSIALGNYTNASGPEAFAGGAGSVASGEGSVALGGSTASGVRSMAAGDGNATANYAMALGGIASGVSSLSGGVYSNATGDYSIALGSSLASGNNSTALGCSTASNEGATAIGYTCTASGWRSVAIGESNIASGDTSTAMGNFATATATGAVAIGWFSNATNNSAVALGSATASGYGSVALGGYYPVASGDYSTATGNSTTASGFASIATGLSTTSSGNYTTAMGYHTTAQACYSTSVGAYNVGGGDLYSWVPTDPLFEVGAGGSSYGDGNSSINHTADALVIYKNGNAAVQGNLSAGGVITAQPGGDIPMFSGS